MEEQRIDKFMLIAERVHTDDKTASLKVVSQNTGYTNLEVFLIVENWLDNTKRSLKQKVCGDGIWAEGQKIP